MSGHQPRWGLKKYSVLPFASEGKWPPPFVPGSASKACGPWEPPSKPLVLASMRAFSSRGGPVVHLCEAKHVALRRWMNVGVPIDWLLRLVSKS